MRAVVVSRSVELAAPIERVWPFMVDTDRFNRMIGMSEVHYRAIDAEGSASGARYVAKTRAAGFDLEYEEQPFEWSHLRSCGVHRRMRGGPIASYTWRVSLERTKSDGAGALEGGTRVHVRFEIVPRSIALRPIAWLNARRFTARLAALGAVVDAHVVEGAASPFVKPVSPSDPSVVAAALERMRKEGVPPSLVAKVGVLLQEGPDADVARMRPYEIAEKWRDERRDVLRAFLKAVPAGLVELRWGIVCPSCLTASQVVRALDEISADGHCQLCDITFGLDLDRAVEATFVPHPSVRGVPEGLFCIGGPARTPHVLVQALLPAGEESLIDVPPETGRFRIFVRGGVAATLEIDEGGPTTARAVVHDDRIEPAQLRAAPGAQLVLTSKMAETRHVKIERLVFATQAATAHEVSTLAEFRTIFSSDLLKRGTPLKVARAAILFSDLTGSTALYTHVGDAAAFRLVDDHFDVLKEVVEKHEGVLIKTMGDALMASFVDTGKCARAAIESLRRFESFREKAKNGDLVGLKLGLFAGACYVVTANGALDYFGQTVNVASRIQHLAESGELVLPEDAFEALGEDDRAKLVVKERFEARVKGVAEPLQLVRVVLAS